MFLQQGAACVLSVVEGNQMLARCKTSEGDGSGAYTLKSNQGRK